LLIPAAQRVLPDGEVFGLDVQPGMIARLKARAGAGWHAKPDSNTGRRNAIPFFARQIST
jgi:ubiquinone/menaquinone biosynthesis C-methylase UbiE